MLKINNDFMLFLIMCVYVWVLVCASERSAHGGQRKKLDPLKPELQAVVSYLSWVLGSNSGLWQGLSITDPSLQPHSFKENIYYFICDLTGSYGVGLTTIIKSKDIFMVSSLILRLAFEAFS